jgi:hypothetical protein
MSKTTLPMVEEARTGTGIRGNRGNKGKIGVDAKMILTNEAL